MVSKAIFVSLFLMLFLSSVFFPENHKIRFGHLSADDGLHGTAVNSILQDEEGFLWFGTNNGLFKYNGYTFKVYNFEPGNPGSLSHNFINVIYEDKNNEIWIGTVRGINRYDKNKDIFTKYFYDSEDLFTLDDNVILSIIGDESGNILVGTGRGLNLFDKTGNRFIRYTYKTEESGESINNAIFTLSAEKNGKIWMGTKRGVYLFYGKKKILISFRGNSDKKCPLNSCAVEAIYRGSDGIVWIGTDFCGLYKYDSHKDILSKVRVKQKTVMNLDKFRIKSLYKNNNGDLWIGTNGGGLYKYIPREDVFTQYLYDPGDPWSISNNGIVSIKEDSAGILWIGTLGGGVNRIDPYKNIFDYFVHNTYNSNSLSHNYIIPIFEDRDGILWIGTGGGGLNRYDKKNKTFFCYKHDPEDQNSLPNNYIRAICEDRSDFLWIATEDGGVSRIKKNDWQNGKFENFRNKNSDPESLNSDHVVTLHVDKDNVLWAGTERGLNRFIRGKDKFARYEFPLSKSRMKNVWTIYEDSLGVLWIGSWGHGFAHFNKKDKTVVHYSYEPGSSNGISHDIITSFFEDKNKILWIGTYGGGLNRLNRAKGEFKYYTKKDGLPDNIIYGILGDKNNHLWLSTSNGLSRFDPEKESFFNYFKSDGLQGNDFNRAAYFKDKNGKMYFGGPNGMNVFSPENIRVNKNIPPVVITSFRVFNKEKLLDLNQASRTGIILNYDENYFSFEFAALDFVSSEQNRYAYLLIGVDKDWVHSGTRRYAGYSNISPGKYIFKVKGSNNDGIWNETGISIPVTILHPFWGTWWFKMLWVSMIILIVSLIIYFTYRHIKLLKEKANSDSFAALGKFASYFAHDIKSPLEGTYLITSEVEKMCEPGDKKKEFLNDILTGINRMRIMVKSTLDFSKAVKPRLEPDDLNALIEKTVKDYKGLSNCRIDLRLDKKIGNVNMDHELMVRVFKNLIENSQHASEEYCLIEITTSEEDSKVIAEVSDHGKGIKRGMLKKIFEPFNSERDDGYGFGLAFVRETVKRHGGEIKVRSVVDEGTTFIITFPAEKEV